MSSKQFWTSLALSALLLAGCSSTYLNSSWKDPGYTGKVKNVYVIGISKQETTRRVFEDEFDRQLAGFGITGQSSYKDMPNSEEIDEAKIVANVKSNGADAVLMALATGKRTEEVVNPGRVSSYGSGPYYGGRGGYGGYRGYGNYYNQRREVIYQPATITQFEVVTIEANLFDVKTKEMIWSAQLETVLESDMQSLITEFIEKVIKDMDSKGLL
jgi:PBP1b-binding outer membrane lipoprotein LpoB